MPSHLTRNVFRRLIANEPIIHQGCLRRRAYSAISPQLTTPSPPSQRQHGVHNHHQRRGFFNFNMFRKAKRDVREADMLPGLDRMMELEKMQRMRARLPAPEDVDQAIHKFFKAKWDKRQRLEDTEAKLALLSLRYLFESYPQYVASVETGQPPAALYRVLQVAGMRPKLITPFHVGLGKFLYEQTMTAKAERLHHAAIETYCKLLCYDGQATEARRLLLENKSQFMQSNADLVPSPDDAEADVETVIPDDGQSVNSRPFMGPGRQVKLWATVLKSAIDSDHAQEFETVLNIIRQRALPNHPVVRKLCLEWALKQGDLQDIQRLWKEYWTPLNKENSNLMNQPVVSETVRHLLRWCLTTGHLGLGHEVVRDAIQINPPKLIWDAIFVWAAGTGKGVDEIARMITVMESSNESIPDQSQWRHPDITTINSLVEFAISKDDPYMAERFIALGRERGIDPDARTYVLQMDYRLSVNDVDGALTSYMNLQDMDLSSNEDVPAVNRLVGALCTSNRHDFDTIMNVAADLSDRRARFEPSTVAHLTLLHLSRDELHDTIDLLNTHAFHYSSTERAHIRCELLAYILSDSTPTARAWDAYIILTRIFDETPREPRTQLITNFFLSRQRPDMAVHIFTHMRAHSRPDTFPTAATYITTFLGAARLHDLEALELIHNQLKLDVNVSPLTTELRNALMMSYTACGRPRKALQFWDEIVTSREGPSYNSIHIALRACERAPFGDMKAREIWKRLERSRVELDGRLWASYAAALAGNGDVGFAMGVVEEAVRKGEVRVDGDGDGLELVVGSLFGAAPGVEKQGVVEEWVRGRWPGVWEGLVSKGVREGESGVRVFVGVEAERGLEP